LLQHGQRIAGRMFGIKQQPVEAGAGEQFGDKAARQAAPQADLLAVRLDRTFETVFPEAAWLASDKGDADGAQRTVIGVDDIALGDIDRPGERAGEHDLAALQPGFDGMQLVDQPGDTGGGMPHDRG